jgi:hypothetical protein
MSSELANQPRRLVERVIYHPDGRIMRGLFDLKSDLNGVNGELVHGSINYSLCHNAPYDTDDGGRLEQADGYWRNGILIRGTKLYENSFIIKGRWNDDGKIICGKKRFDPRDNYDDDDLCYNYSDVSQMWYKM